MSDLMYLGSVFFTLAIYGGGFWLFWQGVELAYWLYCKATGQEY